MRILEPYGPTMGCKGCENKMTGDDARPHSSESRARLGELMRGDDVEAEIIARRDNRREQRAKVIAERNKTNAEEGSEPRTAPQPASSSSNGQQERHVETHSAKRKPDDAEEPGGTRSMKHLRRVFWNSSSQRRTSPSEHQVFMKWWEGSLTVSMRCAQGRSWRN